MDSWIKSLEQKISHRNITINILPPQTGILPESHVSILFIQSPYNFRYKYFLPIHFFTFGQGFPKHKWKTFSKRLPGSSFSCKIKDQNTKEKASLYSHPPLQLWCFTTSQPLQHEPLNTHMLCTWKITPT